MVACQAAAALAAFTLPVVAPAAALSLGLSATLVGYYTTIMLIGAMAATMVTAGFVRRYGALRVSQTTLLFAALGLSALPLATLSPLPGVAPAGHGGTTRRGRGSLRRLSGRSSRHRRRPFGVPPD